MPNYQPHPTKKNTPSRKNRKGARNSVFMYNKRAKRLERLEKPGA